MVNFNHETDNEINHSTDQEAIASQYFGKNTDCSDLEIFFGSTDVGNVQMWQGKDDMLFPW